MTVVIKRVADERYVLVGEDGSEINVYEQATMTHPDDWLADARGAGEVVHGRYDWRFIDDRDQS